MSIKRKITSLLAVTLLATSSLTIFAMPQEKNITNPYTYNIHTDEWESSRIRAERVAMCQIPKDILANLSTEALIETVLEYPFFIDVYAHNSLQQGFESIRDEFNGFEELFNREDFSEKLLQKYQDINVSKLAKSNENVYYLSNIEILLAQKETQEALNEEELDILTVEAQEKYNEKNDNIDYYGTTFATFYEVLSEQQKSESSPLASSATVKTPNGSSVSVIVRGELLSDSQKRDADNQVKSSYPNVTKLRTATTNYNCHSYAWYSTSSSNKYWMNNPSKYWTDGSYDSVSLQNVGEGDKVNYSKGDHSAIVTYRAYGPISSNYDGLEFTSKWGEFGLYEHDPLDSPYNSSSLKFYY